MTEPAEFNVDESKVPDYVLPDPLIGNDGNKITSAEGWRGRRAGILEAFASEVYGRTPAQRIPMRASLDREHEVAIGGGATMRQLRLHFGDDGGQEAKQAQALTGFDGKEPAPARPWLDLLMFIPNRARPAAAFLGLNYRGNQAVHGDPRIALSGAWMREDRSGGVVDHRATERSRGSEASRWPVEAIVSRGYALVTACYGDLDPDYPPGDSDTSRGGIRGLFGAAGEAVAEVRPDAGAEQAPSSTWGSIGMWAWGLSRMLDALEAMPEIDVRNLAVVGHSRLGKAALWAAALDERFAIAISNDSGCGGASLSRRRFGESVGLINTAFPHWFCKSFKRYNDREDDLPVDQHELLALIAPRPVLVCSAEDDKWADPRGEFLSARGADPVYRLLGTDGLASDDMPAVNTPILSTIGYHIRPGGHDMTDADWSVFLDFADRHQR